MNKKIWLKIVLPIVVVVIVAGGAVYYFYYYEKPVDEEEEKPPIVVDVVHAEENFDLVPVDKDSLGIAKDTSFTLTSEAEIDKSKVKESLAVEPKVEFAVKEVSSKEFEITPETDLTDNEVYQFSITTEAVNGEEAPTLREYNWAYQTKNPIKVLSTLPRDEGTYVPTNSGVEVTFSNGNFSNFEDYFEISPKTNGTFEKHKRTAVFAPEALQPETLYTVTVKADLPFSGTSDRLAEDYVFQFETEDNEQTPQQVTYLYFNAYLHDFSASDIPSLEVYSYPDGVERDYIVYQYDTFDDFADSVDQYAELPTWVNYSRQGFNVATDGLTEALRFTAAPQEGEYRKFVVLPESLRNGYYLIETEVNNKKVQAWIQISDQASYLSVSKTQTLVWVNDLVNQEPFVDVTLNLSGETETFTTNSYGVAAFDTPDQLVDQTMDASYYYVATSPDGYKTILPAFSTTRRYYSGIWSWGTDSDHWAYLYEDKPLYLPTDTIKFWGLAKARTGIEQTETVTVSLAGYSYRDYNYNAVSLAETEVEVNEYGTYLGELAINDVTPGYYTLRAEIGDRTISSTSIYVKTYTKPAYSIDLTTDKQVYLDGETGTATIASEFFEGTPVPSVDISHNVGGEGEITTNELGQAAVDFTAQYDSSYWARYDSQWLNASSKMAEEGDISSSLYYAVYPSNVYMDVETSHADEQGNVNVQLNYLDLEAMNDPDYSIWSTPVLGAVVPDINVSGTIVEKYWEKVETGSYYDFINKVTRKTYRYEERQNDVGSFYGTTDAGGSYDYNFDVADKKYYEITVNYTDAAGREVERRAWLSTGWYFSSYSSESQINIRIVGDQVNYQLGDQVDVVLSQGDQTLPSGTEPNNYLFYKSSLGIKDYWVHDSPEYSFTYDEQLMPNAYVFGVMFDGAHYVTAQEKYASIEYDSSEKNLNFEVTTDKERYLPGDEVDITVTVTDQNDDPVRAKLNINLVDEALFKLREQSVDTLTGVYQSVKTGILSSYVSHEKQALDAVGAEGGGCFVKGTPVLMEGGQYKNIEDIKVGDTVLTKVATWSDRLVPSRVSNTFEHLVNEYLLINDQLEITPNHVIWVNGQWLPASMISIGDRLLNKDSQEFVVKSIEKKTGSIYVYNLHTEKYHTFIASDIYVHNDKGGNIRENFQDTALFQELETDRNGEATVEFDLPDNITSWRVTTQAITQDLEAGHTNKLIPVSLPFFVETTLTDQYLTGDQPILKIRSFGTALSSSDSVSYQVECDTLGIDETVLGQAFTSSFYSLPSLTAGTHEIIVSGESGDNEDAIKKTITVVDSHWQKQEDSYYLLDEGLEITGAETGRTTLVFTDQNRGYFYRDLLRMSWYWGHRVDQRYAQKMGMELLNQYFEENYEIPGFDGNQYQTPDGAIGILPYADHDLALSGHMAHLAAAEFDQVALANFFYAYLDDANATLEEVSLALFGLANLDEPVLNLIIDLLTNNDLADSQRIYLAIGLERLGAGELAREIYYEIFDEYGEEMEPYIRIMLGEDEDDYLQYSILMAILANRLNASEEEMLFGYVRDHHPTDILINVEKLTYLQEAIPELSADPVSFDYQYGSTSDTVTLEKGQKFSLQLTADQLSDLEFSNISGSVGLVSHYAVAVSPSSITPDTNLTVTRSYSLVGGDTMSTFADGDIVKVTIKPTIGANAIDDYYQVTDYLPAGLSILTRPYSRLGQGAYDASYAYKINGQVISFRTYRDSTQDDIYYYARIRTLGTYKADSVLMQSYNAKDSLNITDTDTITLQQPL
ncbi:MAG: alpha-2-macroglobulin family protein [Patescibacteria group bacterium]